MEIFRWIMGGLAGLLVLGWVVFAVIGLSRGDDRQQDAASRLRQWGQLAVMFWFNVEIWGRVVYTIWNWN